MGRRGCGGQAAVHRPPPGRPAWVCAASVRAPVVRQAARTQRSVAGAQPPARAPRPAATPPTPAPPPPPPHPPPPAGVSGRGGHTCCGAAGAAVSCYSGAGAHVAPQRPPRRLPPLAGALPDRLLRPRHGWVDGWMGGHGGLWPARLVPEQCANCARLSSAARAVTGLRAGGVGPHHAKLLQAMQTPPALAPHCLLSEEPCSHCQPPTALARPAAGSPTPFPIPLPFPCTLAHMSLAHDSLAHALQTSSDRWGC